MIKELKIREDLSTPEASSDSTCSRNKASQPRYTEIKLSALSDQDRKLAAEQNHQNKGLYMAVEDVLNEKIRKLNHKDYVVKHRLLEGVKPSENNLAVL